jgi:hypothetical protein
VKLFDNLRFGKRDCKGSSNLRELHLYVSEVAMIRRKKDNVLTELPTKSRSKIVIDIPTSYKKLMKKITNDLNAVKEHLNAMMDESSSDVSRWIGMREGFNLSLLILSRELAIRIFIIQDLSMRCLLIQEEPN